MGLNPGVTAAVMGARKLVLGEQGSAEGAAKPSPGTCHPVPLGVLKAHQRHQTVTGLWYLRYFEVLSSLRLRQASKETGNSRQGWQPTLHS